MSKESEADRLVERRVSPMTASTSSLPKPDYSRESGPTPVKKSIRIVPTHMEAE